MERRDFLKTLTAASAAAATPMIFSNSHAATADRLKIGEIKSLKIDVLSETSASPALN